MKITKPGCFDIAADVYHSDPCPQPSLSASIAVTLLDQSPRHAWTAHPRLNDASKAEEKGAFDLGAAAHALILEGKDRVQVIDAADWRTKAAKEARANAYANGKHPLLPHQRDVVVAMAENCFQQLDLTEDCISALRGGAAEQTWIWRSGKTWIRCRPDWYIKDGPHVVYDYKTTGGSAHPDTWSKRLYDFGSDLRAALYLEGAREILGWDDAVYRFVVQEDKAPFALSVIQLSPQAIDLGLRRWEKSLAIWAACVESDSWPGYPQQIAFIDAPPWEETKWSERVGRDEFMERFDDRSALKTLIDWQAPVKGEL
jgi:hypothetical protein